MSMTILKKGVGSAVFREESKKEVFDPEDREHYEKEYKGMQAVANGQRLPAVGGGSYDLYDRIQDKSAFHKNLQIAKRHAEKGYPITLTSGVKNALWKKAKELKDKITPGMVPRKYLHPIKTKQVIVNDVSKVATVVDNDIISRSRAVDLNTAWYKKNRDSLAEFRRIMRVLEPDRKDIGSIVEHWRPD